MVRAVIMSTAGKLAVLIFLVLLHETKGTELDCGPGGEAREASDHTLTCDGIQDGQAVAWIKTAPVFGDITVASCTDASSCQSNFTSKYDVTRPSNVSSTLKILDVERDDTYVEGEWTCASATSSAACYVTVIYAPDIGECVVGFDEMTSQVNGRCEMHKVYPRPTCSWYQTLQGNETQIPSSQTSLTLTQYVDPSKHQIYFRATCELHSPLPTAPGTYSYKVLITPGLVEPQITYTTTTVVAFPATPTLRSCPQDYVTNADVTSCTCVTTDLGSPQGYLAWYDPSNTIILRNTSLVLTLPFSDVIAENSEATYRCAAVHHTGSPNVSYTPKIAVAPNKPVLSGLKEDADYSVDEFVSAACSANGGKPAITRVILACGERRNQSSSQVGDTVVSRLLFKLQGSDKNGLQCACSAANGYFTSENVTVTLKVKGSSTSDSDNGDTKSNDDVGPIVGGVLGFVVAAVLIIGLIAYVKRPTRLGTKGKETHGQTPQEPDNGSADQHRQYTDTTPFVANELKSASESTERLGKVLDNNQRTQRTEEGADYEKLNVSHDPSEKHVYNTIQDPTTPGQTSASDNTTEQAVSSKATDKHQDSGKPSVSESEIFTEEAHSATSGQSSPVTEKSVNPQVQGPDPSNGSVVNSAAPSQSAEAGVPTAQNVTPSAKDTSLSVTQATNETSRKDISTGIEQNRHGVASPKPAVNVKSASNAVETSQLPQPRDQDAGSKNMQPTGISSHTTTPPNDGSASPADGSHSSFHCSLPPGENPPSTSDGSASPPDGSPSPNPKCQGTERIPENKEIPFKNDTCPVPENTEATDKSDKSEDGITGPPSMPERPGSGHLQSDTKPLRPPKEKETVTKGSPPTTQAQLASFPGQQKTPSDAFTKEGGSEPAKTAQLSTDQPEEQSTDF